MLEQLHKILSSERRPRVLVVGDLILDEYLHGSIERISPEAPVPVVDSSSSRTVLGGAANVAHNLAALGCDVVLAGVVGRDAAGGQLREALREARIDARCVVDGDQRVTTHKVRVVAHGQQVLRLDKEERAPLDATTRSRLLSEVETAVADVDGVILSDYHKGVLAVGIVEAVVALARRAGRPVVVDPKGRSYERYRGVAALTPNLRELEVATGMAVDGPEAIAAAAAALQDITQAPALLVTAGADGMWLFEHDREPVHIRTEAREVYDVTGAGDTVVAVFALGLFAGAPLVDAARIANVAAGLVVAKLGTAVVERGELFERVGGSEAAWQRKMIQVDEAVGVVARARQAGRRVVFTNGCFDLLHAGHVAYLQRARSFGDLLIVGLNDDASVRDLKGDKRPLVPQHERAQVLAALESVDMVVLFGEATPDALIRSLRPDVLVKGADYRPEEVVGREFVESYGGRLELVELVQGRSTSGLISQIVNLYGGEK